MNGYTELKKQRAHYARCAIKNKFDLIPKEERQRAQEEANEMERVYSVLFSQHSGEPAPDCPF